MRTLMNCFVKVWLDFLKVLAFGLAISLAVFQSLGTAQTVEPNPCPKPKISDCPKPGSMVGVSWANFQDDRWKADEAAIKATLEAGGASYISSDAQGSAAKQLSDIDAMISQGVDVLIINPWDPQALASAIDYAEDAGIPVISYDGVIEDSRVLSLTFDEVAVGRMIAEGVTAASPSGNFAIIKGDPGSPNTKLVLQGMMDVVQPLIDSGDIRIVGEASTDGWSAENAKRNMEGILNSNGNAVDAVLAQSNAMLGGVIAALEAQGLNASVGGQDTGGLAALNRLARGTQTVSVWRDPRSLGMVAAALSGMLAEGTEPDQINGVAVVTSPDGTDVRALLMIPTSITQSNLGIVIDAGVISKDQACDGAMPGVPACF